MTERPREPGIDRIREHVRAQVARTSLRKVARRAGVKVGATKKFIDGSVPYERNLRAWKRFYARELREGLAGVPDDAIRSGEARAVLELLLWGLPEADREPALREGVELFRDLYARHDTPAPAWVLILAGEMPPEDDDDESAAGDDEGEDDEDDPSDGDDE